MLRTSCRLSVLSGRSSSQRCSHGAYRAHQIVNYLLQVGGSIMGCRLPPITHRSGPYFRCWLCCTVIPEFGSVFSRRKARIVRSSLSCCIAGAFQPALFAKAEKASSTSSVPRPLYSFSQPSKPGYRASRQSRPSMLESSAQTKIFGSPPTLSFEVNALTEWYAPPAGSSH